jgi:hypothetical protein
MHNENRKKIRGYANMIVLLRLLLSSAKATVSLGSERFSLSAPTAVYIPISPGVVETTD